MSSGIEDINSFDVSGGDILSGALTTTQSIKEDLNGNFEDDNRNNIETGSTRSSSPFISNPELIKKDNNCVTEQNSISRRVEDMDTSIASLKESMASIRLSDNDEIALSRRDVSMHNSTMDTTRYNETQAQFDRDIDLDESTDDNKMIPSPQHKKSISPWKQLRSASTSTTMYMGEIPKLHFNQPKLFNNDIRESPISDKTAITKINELNKQITGYRIQIKLFKQFLQNLIDKSRYNDSNIFDISELDKFQSHFGGLSPSKSAGLETSHIDDSFYQNYDELLKLNDDLYANLEDFQSKLHDKEIQLQKVNEYMEDCSNMINDILNLLIDDPTTDNSSKQALVKLVNGERDVIHGQRPLDTKLYVIRLELNKKLENRNTYPSPPPSNPEKEQVELSSYAGIIQELIASLDKLQGEFSSHKQGTSKIQNDLKQEVESTQTVRANYETLYTKFNQLCSTLEKSKPKDTEDEMQKLRSENRKLRSINQKVDEKFDEYQEIIDKLQQEVNEFQINYDNTPANEVLRSSTEELYQKDLLQSNKEVDELQEQLNKVTQSYRQLQEDTAKTISSLTNQLQNKQENLSQSASYRITEQLKNDLDIAVEKQRILKAEKVRLSYSLEALANDKVSLQSTIRNLTDKITSLTVEATQHSKVDTDDTMRKKLSILDFQLGDLLLRDVHEFQKLLKSFVKIADDSSLKEPKRKIDSLSKKIALERDSENEKVSLWDISELTKIREYHKSVFDYFARAVDIIVNDHVKLLLKESEHTSQTSEYVSKLHKRIDDLNNINDTLTRLLQTGDPDESHDETSVNTSASMTSKMRIAELTNRWKAEREARVYENQEAQKRLKELDIENARLRQELDQTNLGFTY